MGLLDYYRQFSGMTDEEVQEELHRQAAERRARELTKVETLDLSGVHWHEFPHPDVVAAITFAARRALNRPPDPDAVELRQELARRHGVEPARVVAGHGAAGLLGAAAQALLEAGDELACPWPSFGLLPTLARRARARAVPVAGGADPERLLAAVNPSTRMVVIANPNDVTGDWMEPDALRALAAGLPRRAWLVLDEALVHFVDAVPPDAALELLDEHPRTLVVRTLSKAYGLAGLRCGWAIGPASGGDEATALLAVIAPAGGLGTPVQAGALEALLECGPLVAARAATVAGERRRAVEALAALPYDVRPSQSNVLWLRLPGVRAQELASRLEGQGVRVAAGDTWGDGEHVRAQVQSPAATDRLLSALEAVAAQ